MWKTFKYTHYPPALLGNSLIVLKVLGTPQRHPKWPQQTLFSIHSGCRLVWAASCTTKSLSEPLLFTEVSLSSSSLLTPTWYRHYLRKPVPLKRVPPLSLDFGKAATMSDSPKLQTSRSSTIPLLPCPSESCYSQIKSISTWKLPPKAGSSFLFTPHPHTALVRVSPLVLITAFTFLSPDSPSTLQPAFFSLKITELIRSLTWRKITTGPWLPEE